jgi:hypothetical protein
MAGRPVVVSSKSAQQARIDARYLLLIDHHQRGDAFADRGGKIRRVAHIKKELGQGLSIADLKISAIAHRIYA